MARSGDARAVGRERHAPMRPSSSPQRKRQILPQKNWTCCVSRPPSVDLVVVISQLIASFRADEDAKRNVGHLEAVLDELATRINELRRQAFEFSRDIAKGAVNPVCAWCGMISLLYDVCPFFQGQQCCARRANPAILRGQGQGTPLYVFHKVGS